MSEHYPFKDIESKWQQWWEANDVYRARQPEETDKKKFYGLVEFPYPSGDGLHVGHPRSYTAIDIVTRKKRMEGYNVMYPMGWDAFGLPAENFAIKKGVHPAEVTKKNIATFKRQIQSLGAGFDWTREINTTDPAYYKWTQWMFVQFYESWFDARMNKARPIAELTIPAEVEDEGLEAVRAYRDARRLAFKQKTTINWCPSCKIGLANEEAQGGVCDRCGGPVEKREKEQWMIRITAYADRLIKELDEVDYLEKIKAQQIHWIGRSEGAMIRFSAEGDDNRTVGSLEVFTTRPDTIFGATYLVLSPEHALVSAWLEQEILRNADAVRDYQEASRKKSDLERQENKEKTGVRLDGIEAVHPFSKQRLPIFIADYVLAGYGTGAIMAVPAHDERDFAFAKAFDLPIETVVEPVTGTVQEQEETSSRIVAIVRRSSDGKLLTLDWGSNHGGLLFIGGGCEDGEDPITCARREILEETGYSVGDAVELSETIHHHYFAHSKGVARNIDAVGLFFELKDEIQQDQQLTSQEDGKFTVSWTDADAVQRQMRDPLHRYLFEKFICGHCYAGDGVAVNSDFLNGMETADAKKAVIKRLEKDGFGKGTVQYKLRDWVFSRQRYWGEPIPMAYCETCGWMPIPETQLPLLLPDVEKYEPTETGESPLAVMEDWVRTTCPSCGEDAKRETDTMPNWAGSSWYFLRYCDPTNAEAFASDQALKYWMPVNLYNGGMEHTTLHLLYSRFWYKVLFDLNHIPSSCGNEPYAGRRSHAMILGEGGVKMSKSKGNVINPDDVIGEFGADVFRVYEMFMGPYEMDAPWDTHGIQGVKRFLEKVWTLGQRFKKAENPFASEERPYETILHQTIKKVTEDIDHLRFNTAVSQMMILTNAFLDAGGCTKKDFEIYLKLLAPFAPHIAEELWQVLGNEGSIHLSAWPVYDPKKIKEAMMTVAVQVNGKVRAEVRVASGASEADVKALAEQDENIKKYLDGQEIRKVIYVEGKILNYVI